MSPYRGPELLAAHHDIERFDCGDETLNGWLRGRAPRNQREGSSRTWVVTDDDRVEAERIGERFRRIRARPWPERPVSAANKSGHDTVATHAADTYPRSSVVAFYASSTAVVARTGATRRAARNQPDPLPAMLLGRLAVDRSHQGQGLAAALLKHFLLKALEVSALTGVRLVLVHAKDDRAASFYRHFGFEPSPIDDLTLMLLVKDIQPDPPGLPAAKRGI